MSTDYKVLRRLRDGCLFSFAQDENRGGRAYPEHRTIYPRKGHGPLATFKTLRDAKKFALNECRAFEIWKVRTRRSRGRWVWFVPRRLLPLLLTRRQLYPYPWGTVLAHSVRLIKRVV